MTAKKDVAVKDETNTAVVLADDLALFQDDIGAGFEGADTDSYAIPFLKLLQKMSPEVDEDSPSYIQGAKSGMLLNTVTNKLFDGKEGFQIVPCAYRRSFVRWGGREGADSGFKGEMTVEEFVAIKDDPKQVVSLDGKHYVPDAEGKVDVKKSDRYEDTRSHYIIVLDPKTGEYGGAILALASTQIKPSKMLMTALNQKRVKVGEKMIQPPTFANIVKVTTIGKQNDKGSWSSLVFELDGMVTDKDLYATSREFYKGFTSGEVKADFSKTDANSTTGGDAGEVQEAEGF